MEEKIKAGKIILKKFYKQQIQNLKDFFSLSDKTKEKIAVEVIETSFHKRLYRIRLISSAIITTLGLINNSASVVIGAMLISPILEPIKTFAFSITNGDKKLFFRSLKTLFFTIIIGIFIGFCISYTIPFLQTTDQILLRTKPTLIDFFVAIFSAIIAILGLKYNKFSEGMAGVAMSVALMPPLQVIGIGFFLKQPNIISGSFLLFITNLIGILVVAVALFFLFGFKPTSNNGKKRAISLGFLIFLLSLILIFPLKKSMNLISENIRISNQINKAVDSYFKNYSNDIKVENIKIDTQDGNLILKMDAYIPENYKISQINTKEFSNYLKAITNKNIFLQINYIQTFSTQTENPDEQKIKEILKKYKNIYLLEQKIIPNLNIANIKLFSTYQINQQQIDEIKNQINNYLYQKYKKEFKTVLEISIQSDSTNQKIFQNFNKFSQEICKNIQIQNLNLQKTNFSGNLYLRTSESLKKISKYKLPYYFFDKNNFKIEKNISGNLFFVPKYKLTGEIKKSSEKYIFNFDTLSFTGKQETQECLNKLKTILIYFFKTPIQFDTKIFFVSKLEI